MDLVLRQIPALEVFVHQFVIGLGGGLEQIFPEPVAFGPDLGRDLFLVEGRAEIVLVPDDFLHPDQVDDAPELFLGADVQLYRHRVCAEALANLLEHARKIGAGAVHLVDEHQPRHVVAIGLPPDRFRLRLDPADRVEHDAGAVENPQRTLDLDGEIHVTGRIDYIDTVLVELLLHAVPETGRGGRGDRNAALLLLLHPVHDGGAVVDFTYFVRNARVEQDPLRGRRLAGIDMGNNADVPIPRNRCRPRHRRIPFDRFVVTSGSARKPCWPRPCDGCPRAS